MQVKILKNCRTPLGPFGEGQIVDIPDSMVQSFINAGLIKPVIQETETSVSVNQIEIVTVDPVLTKEEKIRKQTRLRVQRYRENKKNKQ